MNYRIISKVTAVIFVTALLFCGNYANAAQARISITVQNQPVRTVLLQLASKMHLNIAMTSDVRGVASIAIQDASLDEALTAIVRPLGLTYERSGRLVVIRTVSNAPVPAPIRSAAPSQSSTKPSAMQPAVLRAWTIPVAQAGSILRAAYPRAQIGVDKSASALFVVAAPQDVAGMRTTLQKIDPQSSVRTTAPVASPPRQSSVLSIQRQNSPQIQTAGLSRSPLSVTPRASTIRTAGPATSVVIGRAQVSQALGNIVIALGDQPASLRITKLYRLKHVDPNSAASVIARSFPQASVAADEKLSVLTVTATQADQQRIADAITQLDGAKNKNQNSKSPAQEPGSEATAAPATNENAPQGGTSVEVITLKAAVPSQGQGGSTSATDLATAVTTALSQTAPDLRITVPANSTQLILAGNANSIRVAKELIDQLDVFPPQVVLDTEVLEVDETVARNLGILFPTPTLGSTFSEITPPNDANGNPARVTGILPFTRTGLAIAVELHFLVQRGSARVLADPRITTVSGRTATIRAGDTLSILTTTGGGPGSIATTQLQSFQTGVTLDITPVVNAGNSVSVTLHPTVNSLTGFLNNVPQIATRDTQTTVNLQDNQTLVIGGLIQDNNTRTENKLPLLGDLPLIGKLFRSSTINYTRNELVIVVTPHVLIPGGSEAQPGPPLPAPPTPAALPTLSPLKPIPISNSPVPQRGRSQPNATPSPEPLAPVPTPSAFPETNVFTYGHTPTNTFAGPTDPVQIFYATFSPTVLQNGTLVQIYAITTTNVNNLTIGYNGHNTQLAQISPGKWQAAYNFNTVGLPVGQHNVQLTLTAKRIDGPAASVAIPISIAQ